MTRQHPPAWKPAGRPEREGGLASAVQLWWSSPRPDLPDLDLPGQPPIQTVALPWAQVLDRLALDQDAKALWVLEPDAVHGPGPQAWVQALSGLPKPPLTLVLLPEGEHGGAASWLDAGADRCLPSGTEPSVMQAMLRALLRRYRGMATSLSVFGPLHFDHDAQTLFSGDQRIWLTCRETQVLSPIFRNGAQRIRTEELLKTLGAQGVRAHSKALVALYVHRVNRKIRPAGVQIEAVRGYGYGLRLLQPPSPRPPAPRLAGLPGLSHWMQDAHP